MTTRHVLVLCAAVAIAGCGYRPLYAGERGDDRFSVVGGSPLVADGAVVAEVEAGLRAGLARAGALRPGGGYPRVVVEVLRVDVVSEGVAAEGSLPLARGTRIAVLARAWVERTDGAARERDTGDLRTADVMQVETDARLEALRLDDASRSSARRLGERLARRVLGEPSEADDGM